MRATFRHTPSKADMSGRRDRQAVELNGLGPAVSALVSFTLVRQRPYGLKARLSTTTRWLRADQPRLQCCPSRDTVPVVLGALRTRGCRRSQVFGNRTYPPTKTEALLLRWAMPTSRDSPSRS